MTPVAAAEPVKILALGDSLTAGYGLPEADAFTTRLQQALKDKGYDVQVINAGVSGDTTAGGRARLDWALGDQPDVAVVELGANDGLRGLDPASTRENLDAILTVMKERGVPTLLAGMYAPRNLGREYGDRFNAIYPELAAKHDVPLYPFFLEGGLGPQAEPGGRDASQCQGCRDRGGWHFAAPDRPDRRSSRNSRYGSKGK